MVRTSSTRDPHPSTPSPGLHYYYPVPETPGDVHADICVYGSTSIGVAAAVRAARAGRTVALVAFGRHLGGISAAGLGATDTGNVRTISGLAREFYRQVGEHYGVTEAYGFEPHVAEAVFDRWVAEAGVPVFFEHRLSGVDMDAGRIAALRTENGRTFHAAVYVDATYEGDLLAAAGVTFTVGRESNATYGESLNGAQVRDKHQFERRVDPYVTAGDPSSGLLQGICPDPPPAPGEGDHRIQAYAFRLCLTRARKRIPFPEPDGYDPARHDLLLRYIEAGVFDAMRFDRPTRHGKTDLDNWGAVSTDNIGASYGWPTGDYATRERVFQDHVTYQQGLLHFLATDPRVPDHVRSYVEGWGLAAGEFPETGGWPHELYVREGRRMVSDYVVTEHDCRWETAAPDPVGLASFGMDSHNCERILVDGAPRNEGDVQEQPEGPFGISYRAIVPAAGECPNLVVPGAVSASHIAYGSIRMEPVFMLLGHVAGRAAQLAIEGRTDVPDVPYAALRQALLDDGVVLNYPGGH